MIDFFFSNINQISVCFFLFFFFYTWIKQRLSTKKDNLEIIISNSLSSSTIPTGVALIICAYDESLLNRLSGLNLNLAIAGIVLIFVAYKVIEKD